jgi:hypothetical protein
VFQLDTCNRNIHYHKANDGKRSSWIHKSMPQFAHLATELVARAPFPFAVACVGSIPIGCQIVITCKHARWPFLKKKVTRQHSYLKTYQTQSDASYSPRHVTARIPELRGTLSQYWDVV